MVLYFLQDVDYDEIEYFQKVTMEEFATSAQINLTSQMISNIELDMTLMLELKGIYQVVGRVKVELGGILQECWLLHSLFEKAIHKTYLPIKQAVPRGTRKVSSESFIAQVLEYQLKHSSSIQFAWENNSNKKMQLLDEHILKNHFMGLIDAYLYMLQDKELHPERIDKRYMHYFERIHQLILQEIASSKNITIGEAEHFFQNSINKVNQ